MTNHPNNSSTQTPWYIVGCGRMGTLAAYYLQAAGWPVVVVRPGAPHTRDTRLRFADGRTETLHLPVRDPAACGAIEQLVVACKIPWTAGAMEPVRLARDAVLLRLQNGIGSLDGLLPDSARMIEVVSASAVKSAADGALEVVAENATHFGGGPTPTFWQAISAHWPNAAWHADIRQAQWQKLVVNAAINPLTAIHNVANGALVARADLNAAMIRLAGEADALLTACDPAWPGGSAAHVAAIAKATAGNTSSMRADVLAGSATEIAAINGWLVRAADRRGMTLPAHDDVVAKIHALEGRIDRA